MDVLGPVLGLDPVVLLEYPPPHHIEQHIGIVPGHTEFVCRLLQPICFGHDLFEFNAIIQQILLHILLQPLNIRLDTPDQVHDLGLALLPIQAEVPLLALLTWKFEAVVQEVGSGHTFFVRLLGDILSTQKGRYLLGGNQYLSIGKPHGPAH